ncbi:MAG: UDP-N-acetylmuramoyl-tripeptide--D-alanyl-D-alanine ligase [Bacteroidetes bacterium]|nr:UDP-N-acetylmuramoyl-tripeptide--D-alanyl-D-alanine ligase [Bacteroidota bacterium]
MLLNSTGFTHSELVGLFGTENVFNLPTCMIGVSTDTRTLKKENIFIALKGENFDGHDVIGVAKGKGASVLIIEKKYYEKLSTEIESYPHILVESTLAALGILGQYHRNRLTVKIVAIAGAAGKTSTKDLTAHLLSQKFITHKTEANYNNQIGVPLTLLQLTSEHEAAVIEIGTNEPGEIEILSQICNPTHGLITNIGKEHLEKLIDLDGVEQEETALFRALSSNGGKILINMDDERLRKYSEVYPNSLKFGIESSSTIQAEVKFNSRIQPSLTFPLQGFATQMQTIGLAAAYNAIAAVAIGISLGMTNKEICMGLESYISPEAHGYGRMNLEVINNFTLINDCYNANPESMLIALKTLQLFPVNGKRIAVLGDMRELGESSAIEHRSIIAQAVLIADEVIVIGDEMREASTDSPKVKKASSKHDCVEILSSVISEGDVLLVKGSRGMQMEEVITGLKNTKSYSFMV